MNRAQLEQKVAAKMLMDEFERDCVLAIVVLSCGVVATLACNFLGIID